MKVCGVFDVNSGDILACWLADADKNFVRAGIKKGLSRPINPTTYPDCEVMELRNEDKPEEDIDDGTDAVNAYEEVVSQYSLVMVNPKQFKKEVLQEE